MILAPNHRDALHANVLGILRGYAHTLDSTQDVADAMSAVFAVVHEACADFKNSWNCRPRAAWIMRLPDELLAATFHFMDFKQRMVASQVCRAWRATALSARTLWTDIILYYDRKSGNPSALCSLLIPRSHPVPFRLTIVMGNYYQDPSPDTVAIFRRNIWRLESYSGDGRLALMAELGQCRAPALISVNFGFGSGDVLRVSNLWGGGGSSHLYSMRIGSFSFASDIRPFTALQHFSGRLTLTGREAIHLFQLCPRLLTLRLSNVFETSVLPSPPLPPFLQEVTLEMASIHGYAGVQSQDPSTALSAWKGWRLRGLNLLAVDTIDPGVRLFTKACRGPWSLFVSAKDDLTLSAADDVRYTIRLTQTAFYNPFRALAIHTGRIERLVITAPCLLGMHSAQIHLPALHSLQILFRREFSDQQWQHISASAGGIVAPLLATMDLILIPFRPHLEAAALRCICHRLPLHLRELISFHATILRRVTLTLVSEQQSVPSTDDLAPLAQEVALILRPDLSPDVFDDLSIFPADPKSLLTDV